MFRFLTAIACVVILPVYGFSLYAQLSRVPDLGGNVFWFLCGTLVLGIVYLLARPSFILLVLLHELNHAVVGWLMGARIRSLEASDTAGGAVKYDFEYTWGHEIICLAPYFFQPIPLALVVVKAMVRSAFDPLICFAMGVTWAWFYFDLGTTFQAPQLDITKAGTAFSLLVILAMNLVFTGIVLCSVSPETSVIGFLWDGPVALYRLLSVSCGTGETVAASGAHFAL